MEQFSNNANTTLNGTITSGAVSLVVTSATAFPTTGNFRILVDTEIMVVTAVAGTTFTITRAQETTSAASHTSGVAVTHILTAGSLATINASISGLSTARPAATGSRAMYYCTDIPVAYFDDPIGLAWMQFASEYLPKGVAASGYTTTNMALVQLGDTIRAVYNTNAGSNAASALIAGTLTTSLAWTVTLIASVIPYPNAIYPSFGVYVATGASSGTMYGMSISGNGAGFYLESDVYTVGGARTVSNNGVLNAANQLFFGTGRLHLRLLNDATNLHFQISADGFQWMDWYTSACPAALTDYGWAMGNGSSTNADSMALIYSNVLGTPTTYATTGATTPGVITIGTHTIQVGDYVAVHGVMTGLNTGTGNNMAGAVMVVAVASTTITVGATGSGSVTAGTVTLLSR